MSHDPIEKILSQFQYDPRVQGFFTGLRQTVANHPEDAQKIAEHISDTDKAVIKQLQEAVVDVSLRADVYLGNITEAIFRGLHRGSSERQYILQYCTTRDIIGDQQLIEHIIPTPTYIFEHEFIDGDALLEERRELEQRLLTAHPRAFLYSSANEIISTDDAHFLRSVRSRVKSRHRRTTKLTEVVCQGVIPNSKIRNISDGYALAIILDDWGSMGRKAQKDAKNFIRDWFDPSLLRWNGFEPEPSMTPEDRLHYAVFCFLNSKVSDVVRGTVDDCLRTPLVKGSGRDIDQWKGIRASVIVDRIPLEIHVKTQHMLEKEYDSSSALFHPRYALQQEQDDRERWTAVHDAIYDILDSVLHGGAYRGI